MRSLRCSDSLFITGDAGSEADASDPISFDLSRTAGAVRGLALLSLPFRLTHVSEGDALTLSLPLIGGKYKNVESLGQSL